MMRCCRVLFLCGLMVGLLATVGCGGGESDGETAAKDAAPSGKDVARNKDAAVKDAPVKDGAAPKPDVFAITGKPGFDTPKKVVNFVADSLKSGEFDQFWTLAVTVDDVKSFKPAAALLEDEAAIDVVDKSSLGLRLYKMTNARMDLHERSWRKAFDAARVEVDFAKAQRGGVDGAVTRVNDMEWQEHTRVYFTLEGRSYELKLGKLLLTPRGWLILDDDPLSLRQIDVDVAN